ncbi:MAG: 3-hydroxyacyl-CoA dehydrogenase, partial [Alphaproteobacteria bacterium]|nr:3-hydroxyacyl-CoA dehydrogenase [Alphaproteobacteria bacterium]
ALARQLRKIGVRSGMTDGFIGNRVNSAYRQAAEFMLEDGASVVEIDTAMRDFGFPMGPFEVSDLAGLDIAWARRQRLAATRDPSARYVAIPDRLCELGRLGRKVGRGWYTYPRGARSGQVDPEVTAIIAEERVFQGIEPQKFSREDIQQQCLAAMVNEGAKLLDEGVARCPSDIDVVMIHGFAYPRWRGGPMQTADAEGLFKIKRDLERLAREEPLFWTPSPRFDELVKNGLGFASLNPK